MKEHAGSERDSQRRQADADRPPSSAPAAAPARVLMLQRAAGNRATTRALARWTTHPDPEKKGAMVPDVVAADFLRFNPPKNP